MLMINAVCASDGWNYTLCDELLTLYRAVDRLDGRLSTRKSGCSGNSCGLPCRGVPGQLFALRQISIFHLNMYFI